MGKLVNEALSVNFVEYTAGVIVPYNKTKQNVRFYSVHCK